MNPQSKIKKRLFKTFKQKRGVMKKAITELISNGNNINNA